MENNMDPYKSTVFQRLIITKLFSNGKEERPNLWQWLENDRP